MKIICSSCKKNTNHEIVKQFETIEKGKIDSGNDDIGVVEYENNNTFQILQCKGCETVTFRHNVESDTFDTKDMFYPERSGNRLDIKPFYYGLPTIIWEIYGQTIHAYNSRFRHLCAAGIRMLVEGICLDKKIKGGTVKNPKTGVMAKKRTLEAKINGLVAKGILTSEQAGFLHETRILGNETLHELRDPELSQLKTCIEIVEQIVQVLYVLPHKVMIMNLKKEF